MRLTIALTVASVIGHAAAVHAQDITPMPTLEVGTTEWMATAGPALGVTIFNSARGHKYFLQSLSWGRILSGPHGPGALRGRFEWSIEFIPIFSQYQPARTYGFGVTPLVWRWNFETQGRLAPFAELAGGTLFTRDPVPDNTTTANFTAHASYGVRYFLTARASVVASYRFHHISNGNRLERNPGVNAHVLQFGVSVLQH